MKRSIRTKFLSGMIFLFLIILVLSVFSGYYMNNLSDKTSAIHKENYLSIVYAREMSSAIMNINQEITTSLLMNRNSDSLRIVKELQSISISLLAAKNNVTEPGEDKLISAIESEYTQYKDSVLKIIQSPKSAGGLLYLQTKSGHLNNQFIHLSEINGRALEAKTEDAKVSSKRASTQMTILASFCFLIGMSFTFSFASYFSQRFFQLHNGIKEIVSSNYDKRLFFEGNDEFYEISLVFNEMAEKLKKNTRKIFEPLKENAGKEFCADALQELKTVLFRIKSLEEQTAALISRLEKKE